MNLLPCRLLLLAAVLLPVGAARAEAPDAPDFTREVLPLLSDNCFACHGPDEAALQAELRLDVRKTALTVIEPGRPEESELLRRVMSDDDDERMPPPETGKRLSAEQIDVLSRWIAAGAEYKTHWSFQPLVRPAAPQADSPWPANPIDCFILDRLRRQGIGPSPEADRATLVRRLYLDFLGLLPSVEQVDAFVSDRRPGAYDRLLDRVLASPRFGERWGRHWLDQARYADSHGYTNDNARTMWPYRDWVIAAVNRDLPFDEFTIEQLAGDLLPGRSLDQQIATGFHRNTLINSEGGTKADQFRDEQVKDRVDTTGVVWLGLTVGCAKCHSHKFDPVTQKEYYQLYAFFNSTADNNSITPTIKAPSFQQRQRQRELEAEIAELAERLKTDPGRSQRQRAWEQSKVDAAAAAAADKSGDEDDGVWTVLPLSSKSENSATFETLEDGSQRVGGPNVAGDEYKLTARSPLTAIRSVRLEALTDPALPENGPGRAGNGNFVLSEFWFRTGDGRELRFSKAQADHSQQGYDVAHAIDGKSNTGWAVNGSPEGGPNHNRTAWFVLPKPLEVEQDHALTFTMQFDNGSAAYNLGRLRLSISAEAYVDRPSDAALAKLAAIAPDDRTPRQQQRLDEAFLQADPRLSPVYDQLQQASKRKEQLGGQVPTTMVLQELDKPRTAHLQIRGDFLRPADEVQPDVPAVLPAFDGESGTRLDLARWLTRPDHPLTPRVRMNRVWMRLFGRGLVETENDFGVQGTPPSHPQLLDYLATELVRQNWSTKRMLRMIARSSTYRQSSRHRDDVPSDPRNRLLWRQNRLRVEGEIIRDLALAASGLLSGKIGGPSVFPPQPEGIYDFTQRKKNWKVSGGEDRYRRGMYTFFYRSAPYPMLTTFDAPKFNQTCTMRSRSNTPIQALTAANDEALFEATTTLARRVLRETGGRPRDAQLRRLFRICLARQPSDAELQFLDSYWQSQQQHFQQHAEAARQLASGLPKETPPAAAAAWVATARVILNLDEFITRE